MKLMILDRDGVINHDSAEFIKSADEWIPIPGSLEAIAKLNHKGYHVAVATNQSGIARGLFTLDTLNSIHKKMHDLLAQAGGHIDGIFFCPHGPDDGCDCRKPKPGLYLDIAHRCGIDLRETTVIGDSLRDLEAAREVGAKPILVRTGKGAATEKSLHGWEDLSIFDNLQLAVSNILD